MNRTGKNVAELRDRRPDLDLRHHDGFAVLAENSPCHQSGGLQIERDGLGLDLVVGQHHGEHSQAREHGPHLVKLGCRLEAGQLRPAVGSGCHFHPVHQCVGERDGEKALLPRMNDQRRQADTSERPAVTAADRERPPSGLVQGQVESSRGCLVQRVRDATSPDPGR